MSPMQRERLEVGLVILGAFVVTLVMLGSAVYAAWRALA